MNRRNFLSKTVITAAILPVMGLSETKPKQSLRRIHILRNGKWQRSQPFSAARKGDVVEICSSADDEMSGQRVRVDGDATLSGPKGMKLWGFVMVPFVENASC